MYLLLSQVQNSLHLFPTCQIGKVNTTKIAVLNLSRNCIVFISSVCRLFVWFTVLTKYRNLFLLMWIFYLEADSSFFTCALLLQICFQKKSPITRFWILTLHVVDGSDCSILWALGLLYVYKKYMLKGCMHMMTSNTCA